MAAWNCATGLLNHDGSPTDKVVDMHAYIKDHNLHLLAITECDLYDLTYKTKQKRFTRQTIENAVHLQGYDVWFPRQWTKYGFCRIIIIVKSDLAIKEIPCPAIEDLPIMMAEIGTLREPKTRVAFIYMEYTSYITGLGTMEAQEQRLDWTLHALRVLTRRIAWC